jgi:antibiotic biosynthesis monooxygenase (ABM) superfamily enzyme
MSGEASGVGEVRYEVTSQVEAGAAEAWRAWLPHHIEEIVALPGVLGAEAWEVTDPAVEGRRTFCAVYRMRDAAALASYLAEHAPRLRADAASRFGARFVAQRRVGEVFGVFSPPSRGAR